MPIILAIDTTSEFGSIALYDGARDFQAEVTMHSPDGFGHILFHHIAALLDGQGVNVLEIDCFAAASGPGSFTGVRVGLAAAKALAEAAGKPVAAVSNLKALAWFGAGPVRATVIDARRGDIYGAVYGERLEAIRPERVMKFQAWLEEVPDGAEFIGASIAPFLAALSSSRFAGAPATNPAGTLSGAVARIAHAGLLEGRAGDPAAADANYVRRSDAELFWKEY